MNECEDIIIILSMIYISSSRSRSTCCCSCVALGCRSHRHKSVVYRYSLVWPMIYNLAPCRQSRMHYFCPTPCGKRRSLLTLNWFCLIEVQALPQCGIYYIAACEGKTAAVGTPPSLIAPPQHWHFQLTTSSANVCECVPLSP